jgi:hypothetical protein
MASSKGKIGNTRSTIRFMTLIRPARHAQICGVT